MRFLGVRSVCRFAACCIGLGCLALTAGCDDQYSLVNQGDSLLLVYGDDPDTLNPVTGSDTVSQAFQREVYEPLATRKFENPEEWENYLAESYEIDNETNTYTIRLREGVYWHPMKLPDGTPLPETEFTAEDVVFTFHTMLNDGVEAGHIRSYYIDAEATSEADKYKIEVEKIDRYTVKVRWHKPYFLSKEFTLNVPMIPRHVFSVDERGDPVTFDFLNSREFAELFNNHWANTRMCGTGPMRFGDWERERRLVLLRNEDYWGDAFPFGRVVYRHIANSNTARKKLLQNEADFVGLPEKQHYVQDKNHPAVKEGRVKLVNYEYPGYRYIGWNLRHPFFREKKVRWALSHAVPVQEIIDVLFYGLANRVNGPFAPETPTSDDTIPYIEFDLNRARELLDEAGWLDSDGNGIRDKIVDGERVPAVFDLIIFADSPTYRSIAAIIKENFRKIQVDVKVTPTKWALMLQKLRKKEFDACILGWATSWKSDPFQIWHGSQAEVPDSSNSIGYDNPEVNELIEELRVTMDEEKQPELYQAIHRKIHADQPYTFLFSERRTAGYDARLKNIKFYKIRPCFDMREWRVSEERTSGR